MAKLDAPLLSFGARGTIAKTQTYASWRGINYARQRVTPANPQTAEQTSTRSVFSWLNAVWKLSPALVQAPWVAASAGNPYTDRNWWISKNLPVLRPITDLAGLIGSPGALGGLAPALVTPAGGAGTADFTMTDPSLPTGWAIASGVAMVILDQDAHVDTDYESFAAADVATPFAPSIAGLAAGTYRWAAWYTFTRPDGRTAYGPSVGGTVVVT